jgi:hypothetical protein
LLLLGAQVIAEYERIGSGNQNATPQPLRTYPESGRGGCEDAG